MIDVKDAVSFVVDYVFYPMCLHCSNVEMALGRIIGGDARDW